MSMFPTITRAALDAADLDIPTAVTEAEKFAVTAAELRASLAATIPPALDAATANTAAKLVNQRAEFVALHAARIEAASQLVTIAEARVEAAWQQAAQTARPAFAAAFDRLGTEFGRAIDARGITADNVNAYRFDPGATEVFALAERLDALAAMRDEFAAQQGHDRGNGTYSDDFERLSRHLVVLDRRGVTNTPDQLHPHQGTRGPEHWAAAHRSPLFRVAWQELAQQREQVRVLTQP